MSLINKIVEQAMLECRGLPQLYLERAIQEIDNSWNNLYTEESTFDDILNESNPRLDMYYENLCNTLAQGILNLIDIYYTCQPNLPLPNPNDEYVFIKSDFYEGLKIALCKIDGKYFAQINTRKKILFIHILNKQNLISDVTYNFLYNNHQGKERFKSSVLHEMTHFLDSLMRAGNCTFSSKPITGDEENQKYYNQKDEINAYTKQIEGYIDKYINIVVSYYMQDPSLELRDVFKDIFNDLIQFIFARNLSLKKFYNKLYPKNKSHVYRDIFFYIKQILIDHYYIYNHFSMTEPNGQKNAENQRLNSWLKNHKSES